MEEKPVAMFDQKNRAFTLIELLVVISIIALLMSILMPTLNRVKNQAKSVMCQGRLREWGMLFKMYTDDYQGNFNPGWDTDEPGLWMNALRPYYKDNWDMLLCPTAARLMLSSADWGTFKAASREIPTPGGSRQNYVFSYGINSWTNNMKADRPPDRPVGWFWKNVNNISGADKIPVFADSTWHDAWPRHTDSPAATMDAYGIGDRGTTGEINHFCIDRHDGFINSMFMDWSARRVGLKELWTLKWHREFVVSGVWTKAGGADDSDWPVWLRHYPAY